MPRDHDSPSRHADRDNGRDDAPSSRHHQRRDDDPWRGRPSDLHGHRHDDHRHDRRERDDAAKRDRWLDDADLDAIGVGAPPAGSVGQWLGARASPMEVTSPHQWTATMTVTTRFLLPPSAAFRRAPQSPRRRLSSVRLARARCCALMWRRYRTEDGLVTRGRSYRVRRLAVSRVVLPRLLLSTQHAHHDSFHIVTCDNIFQIVTCDAMMP